MQRKFHWETQWERSVSRQQLTWCKRSWHLGISCKRWAGAAPGGEIAATACRRMCTSSPHLSNRDGITGIHTAVHAHTHHHHNYMTARHRISLNTVQTRIQATPRVCFCWLEEMSWFVSEMRVYLSEVLWLQRCLKIIRACGFFCLCVCVSMCRLTSVCWCLPVAPL